MFLLPYDPAGERIRAVLYRIVPHKKVCQVAPVLHTYTTMAKRSSGLLEHPSCIGVVEVHGVLVPEIKFHNTQRIVVALALLDLVRKLFLAQLFSSRSSRDQARCHICQQQSDFASQGRQHLFVWPAASP